MASTVASILGASVPPDQPLMEAGLDSLGAVDLRNALGAGFDIELPAAVTFDHPTVEAMAAYIGAVLAPLQQQQQRQQLAPPHWPGSAAVAPGQELGACAAAAVQVVGLACVYPGAAAAGTARPSASLSCAPPFALLAGFFAELANEQVPLSIVPVWAGDALAACRLHQQWTKPWRASRCKKLRLPRGQGPRAAPAQRASGGRRCAARTCRAVSPASAGRWSAYTRRTWRPAGCTRASPASSAAWPTLTPRPSGGRSHALSASLIWSSNNKDVFAGTSQVLHDPGAPAWGQEHDTAMCERTNDASSECARQE